MKNTVIQSEDLLFYPTQIEDLDKIVEMESDRENSKFVYNWDKETHKQVIDSENWMHVFIRKKGCQNIIGYILLDGINSEHDTIELTRVVINEKGKGYGRQSIRVIKKLCFEILGCHRLWLDVFDYNSRAIELYKSEGFIQEGVLRECKKINCVYQSMRIFSMLKEEYKNVNKLDR